ncbi:MAG: SdpI family protein [Bacteroidota bacterium]|nr:SdpI family protein [Bacteroidota bacterium]
MDVVSLILLWFPAVFMLGLTTILRRFPPHSSNMTYGYRTRRSMASAEAWDHAQVRAFQLTRDWTIGIVLWTPLAHWIWGGESAILVMSGLLTLGVMLPLFFVERELKQGPPYTAQGGVYGTALACCFLLLLSIFRPITHDGSEPERRETGALSSVGSSTSSDDVFLRLEDDECHYYINRGLEMGIDTLRWSEMLTGREITLEVVDRPAGLNWFGSVGAVRGVMFQDDTLYRTGAVRNP